MSGDDYARNIVKVVSIDPALRFCLQRFDPVAALLRAEETTCKV